MPEKIDITTLQDPRDYLAEHGAYALVGLYMRTYWESLEIGDKLSVKVLDSEGRAALIKHYQDYQNWLGIAADLLPEWATDMLADIDVMLEEGKGM